MNHYTERIREKPALVECALGPERTTIAGPDDTVGDGGESSNDDTARRHIGFECT